VEDRNLLARTAVGLADVVVVVGNPGVKGTHSLLRVIRDCMATGVEPERILPVVNRAPRRRGERVETARTVHQLLVACDPGAAVLSPVFLAERRHIDAALRDGVALPDAIVRPITDAVRARLDATTHRAPARPLPSAPVPVAVGSLGDWSEEDAG
jgi:hypothetical protein